LPGSASAAILIVPEVQHDQRRLQRQKTETGDSLLLVQREVDTAGRLAGLQYGRQTLKDAQFALLRRALRRRPFTAEPQLFLESLNAFFDLSQISEL
jgi:hypothetical protein